MNRFLHRSWFNVTYDYLSVFRMSLCIHKNHWLTEVRWVYYTLLNEMRVNYLHLITIIRSLDILGLKSNNMKKHVIIVFVLGKRMIMAFLGN
jgi:hypothetical protein